MYSMHFLKEKSSSEPSFLTTKKHLEPCIGWGFTATSMIPAPIFSCAFGWYLVSRSMTMSACSWLSLSPSAVICRAFDR